MPSTASTPVTATNAAYQAKITQLNAVIAAANLDIAALGATRQAQYTARTAIAYAQAAILDLRQAGALATPQHVTVGVTRWGAQSIYSLAQQYLGDALRYTEIMMASGLHGTALTAGQILIMPGA